MKLKIPEYAKVNKGHWATGDAYGKVWCKIFEIHLRNREMSLSHPKYGVFAWVSIDDCVFSGHMPKNNVKTNKALKEGHKDGFYLYHVPTSKYIENLHSIEDDKLIYNWLENKIGKWSRKTANKYMDYECHQYEYGDVIESYSW